ncbi:MAG: DUF3467 domain-containing protein [Deltaproteobacteria bacterium]|jgi:hypothetical protein|nr:MAG: DUF3467 domain-containing protein [Deltaproteobacteria bacterium]
MSDDHDAANAQRHGHQHQHQMTIHADPVTSLGVYANLMMVSHRKEEFVLDFLFVQPQQATPAETLATLRSRIVTTPEHAKRIVRALQENIQRYEAAFGVTAEATDLPRNVH